MSIVYVTNVVVGRNPSGLFDPFELEISFECLEPLEQDLEWRLIYVGSAEDKTKDQELDSIALGPIQRGALRFSFTTDAPDYTKIDKEDINGITIILLSGAYRDQEFVRVGWYVHNFFPDPHYIENPPDLDAMTLEEMIPKMRRVILADNPRVTRFNIDWDRPNLESSFMLINEGGGSTTTSIDGIPSGNMWNTINTTIENILPGGIAPSSALDNRMRDDLSMMQIDENINHRMEALSIVDASTIQSGFQSNDEFNEQFHKQNEGWKNNSIINYTSGHCFNISEDAEMAFH